MPQDQPPKVSVPLRSVRAKAINPVDAVYRGHYDLAEFVARYGLPPLKAREIFERIGPARRELDKYMHDRAK